MGYYSGVGDAWEEKDDGSNVCITFDGIDAERRANAEMEEVRTRLTGRRQALPGLGAILWAIGAVLALVLSFLAAAVIGAYLEMPDRYDVKLTGIIFICIVLVVGVIMQRRQNTRAFVEDAPASARPSFEDRFMLRMGPSEISLEGAYLLKRSWPLSTIERIEGGPRLTLVTRDGVNEHLACVLTTPARHGDLADRINVALATIRASTTGYRG